MQAKSIFSTGEYHLTRAFLERQANSWLKYCSLVICAALVQKFAVPKFDLNSPKYVWEYYVEPFA